MHPDLSTEAIREAVNGGPAWWVYVAFIVLSFLGAALGFQYVGPNERLGAVELQNVHQEAEIDSLRNSAASAVALLCEMSTPQQHRLARVECPR